jgi:colanic acid/amylovoran biosynthesis glycosyltransferase
MKSRLVFLTKTFPFASGEEFIENELPALAQRFDKVILIATSVPDAAKQTRSVPENVEIHKIYASDVNKALLRSAAGYFFHIPKEYESDADKLAIGHSPEKRLFRAYFLAKGLTVAKKASAILEKTDISQADGITFYSYWFYDTALAAIKLKQNCKARKCHAYSRAHRYDLYPEFSPVKYLPLRPYLLDNLNGVFPCSEDGTCYLKRSFPELAAKISTRYLGTADHGMGPDEEDGVFRIASCCHISPLKRVELLAQALAKLSNSELHLEWIHFGGGSELESLKQYAAENLSFMKVTFAGETANSDLMKFYQQNRVDLFVNTSTSEGLPVSIMEACSFGIPIAATDVGGTREIVHDGENGYLLDSNLSPKILAETIASFCRKTKEERAAMRRASREIWEKNFNASENYENFARNIYPK